MNNGPQGDARSQRPDADIAGTPQASILLVDDHPANLVALEATLAPLGQRLVSASSGREALKALLVDEFAVILLDVQMPDLDGFETAALIRAHPRTAQIPIIFVTAIHRDQPHVARGYEYRCVDYLAKPFDPGILRSKVSVLVDIFLREKRIEAQATALRQREREELRRSGERRMQRLIDSVPVSIWALRADGTFYDCNRAWTEYAGLTKVTDVRVDPAALVHPEDLPQLRQAWASAFARGEPLDAQCRLRRATDGTFRWHVGRAVPERDDGGAVIGWIVTAADIESQKRAEDEYARVVERERQAREEAEAANRAKDEFLATLSHELRTPLAAMVGWTGMLRSGNLSPEKSRKALETIERNAKAQAVLIEDILDVSRIITGKMRVDLRPLDLAAVVEAAHLSVAGMAESKGIQLTASLDRSLDPIAGDRTRLEQVVTNLLTNSIKFTPKGGRISILLERIPGGPGGVGQAHLEVADNGIGIDAAFLPRIFNRLTQEDSSSTRSHTGLGLGLAIVRYLVEAHGGLVRAESGGVGRGATFHVALPLLDVLATSGQGPGRSPSKLVPEVALPPLLPAFPAKVGRLAGRRILVVEDDALIRDSVAEILEHAGAQVTKAASAAEGVALFVGSPPDGIVCDLAMPREDGYGFIRKVRALDSPEGQRVPAMALTALPGERHRERALSVGFQSYLVKPVGADQLLDAVAGLLGLG